MDWDLIAERSNGHYAAEDFERTAYRLTAEQVLYHADRGSRAAYWLVERYERSFRDVLDPIGIELTVNRQLRYVVAMPRHGASTPASTMHTLVALVLRGVYDEFARAGGLTDEGEVVVDSVELGEKFRLMTGREMPSKAEFDAALRVMKRWGIARRGSDEMDDGAGYSVVIRPGIIEVLGESALARLAQWGNSGDASAGSDGPEEDASEMAEGADDEA